MGFHRWFEQPGNLLQIGNFAIQAGLTRLPCRVEDEAQSQLSLTLTAP